MRQHSCTAGRLRWHGIRPATWCAGHGTLRQHHARCTRVQVSPTCPCCCSSSRSSRSQMPMSFRASAAPFAMRFSSTARRASRPGRAVDTPPSRRARDSSVPPVCRRNRSRNSLLPSLSCTGDSTASSRTSQSDNSSRANAIIESTALCRSAGSRTTPRPFRTISGPHSNCGFTRHIRSPPASTLRQIAGRSFVRLIKEQSVTTRS